MLTSCFGRLWPLAYKSLKGDFENNLGGTDQIGEFYENGFLQEHLYMSCAAHKRWGVSLINPLLDEDFMLGCERDLAKIRSLHEKFPLRIALLAFNSLVAMRVEKAQMALSLTEFRRIFRSHLESEFEDQSSRIPGINYDPIFRMLRSDEEAGKQELRVLWAMYNLHLWFRLCNVKPPNMEEFLCD